MIAAIVCRGFGPAASIALIVTRGFGISSTPPVATDTHDGVFDEKTWRKIQKRLRKQSDGRVDEDRAKRTELRRALETAISGASEPVKAEVAGIIQEIAPQPDIAKLTLDDLDLGLLSQRLQALNLNLRQVQRDLLIAAAAEWERQDEEDIELLLTGIL